MIPDAIILDLQREYQRSIRRHPDAEWAELTPTKMRLEIEKELNEFTDASAVNDYHGDHGMIAEMRHVTMTALRAYRELLKRTAARRGQGEA